jgi:hypothetical protein
MEDTMSGHKPFKDLTDKLNDASKARIAERRREKEAYEKRLRDEEWARDMYVGTRL